jgi:stress response protein YsnF
MITQDQVRHLTGATAYDRSGDRIGKVGGVYFDDRTDEPKWVTVHTGLFGTKEAFVPVHDAELGDDRVTVAYEKATIKDAPHIDEDGHLSPQEEEQLYRHYGLAYDDGDARATTANGGGRAEGPVGHDRVDERDGRDAARQDRDTVGRDTSGRTTDDAMTRSEEQLRVGTENREAGRARLRKRVVTEHQQVSVPVSHEEVTLEREPVTEATRGAAHDGPAIS